MQNPIPVHFSMAVQSLKQPHSPTCKATGVNIIITIAIGQLSNNRLVYIFIDPLGRPTVITIFPRVVRA